MGEFWFNLVMVPVGLALLVLMVVGFLIVWCKTTWKIFNCVFMMSFMVAIGLMIVGTLALIWYCSVEVGYLSWVVTVGLSDIYAFFFIWLVFFVFIGVVVEYWRGARIRKRCHGGCILGNMFSLMMKSKWWYVGYVVYVGVVLAFLGFIGVVFKSIILEILLHLGDLVICGSYYLIYISMTD